MQKTKCASRKTLTKCSSIIQRCTTIRLCKEGRMIIQAWTGPSSRLLAVTAGNIKLSISKSNLILKYNKSSIKEGIQMKHTPTIVTSQPEPLQGMQRHWQAHTRIRRPHDSQAASWTSCTKTTRFASVLIKSLRTRTETKSAKSGSCATSSVSSSKREREAFALRSKKSMELVLRRRKSWGRVSIAKSNCSLRWGRSICIRLKSRLRSGYKHLLEWLVDEVGGKCSGKSDMRLRPWYRRITGAIDGGTSFLKYYSIEREMQLRCARNIWKAFWPIIAIRKSSASEELPYTMSTLIKWSSAWKPAPQTQFGCFICATKWKSTIEKNKSWLTRMNKTKRIRRRYFRNSARSRWSKTRQGICRGEIWISKIWSWPRRSTRLRHLAISNRTCSKEKQVQDSTVPPSANLWASREEALCKFSQSAFRRVSRRKPNRVRKYNPEL